MNERAHIVTKLALMFDGVALDPGFRFGPITCELLTSRGADVNE